MWTHYYDTHFLFEPHPDAPETNFGKNEIDLYDGEIRYTDTQLGRLFDKLRALGLWDKTIIVITADHGDGFGEHGIPPNKRHGYHLYRNETKVPLLVRVPGMTPRVVETMATHVDIVPTVLNLLGQPKDCEPQLFGDSLVDFMLGHDDPARRVFQEVWYEGPTSKKAVVDRRYHYIRNLVPEDTAELYDETTDPAEDHDLSGTLPVEKDLAAALAVWMDEIAIPANFRKAIEGAIQTSPITPQTKLGDALGDWLVLDGADLPSSAKAGDSIEVVLIWHVKRPAPSGWRIFMHFVGTNNDRLNADHQPIENLLPLQEVRPETWLRDRVRVTVPANWPAGKLHVIVGLWKPNERAPATGTHVSDRAIAVGDIEVVR